MAVLAPLYAAFIAYGCLVPFRFYQPADLDYAATCWDLVTNFDGLRIRSDFAANFLLFIPLGYLTLGALGRDRGRWQWLLAPVVALGAGLFSLGLEVMQHHVVGRTPYSGDVLANTLGGVAGVLLWLACGQRNVSWLRNLALDRPGVGDKLLTAYVLFVVSLHLLPLDFTLSPVEIYRKYRDGGVRLVYLGIPSGDEVERLLWQFAYFLPGGLLWSFRPAGQRWRWPRVLLVALAFAAAIEFLQLFVVSRNVHGLEVLLGGIGGLAGWAIGVESQRGKRRLLPLWTVAWLAAVLFISWRPFAFDFGAPRQWPATWIPLRDYQSQDYLHALGQLVRKGLLYLPGGLLFRALTGAHSRPAAFAIGFTLAGVLECGQLYLPSRLFSPTDVYVEAVAFLFGFVVASIVGERHRWSSSKKDGPPAIMTTQ